MEVDFSTPRAGYNNPEAVERKDELLRKCRDAIKELKIEVEGERESRISAESRYVVLEEKYFKTNLDVNTKNDQIAALRLEFHEVDA